MQVLLIQGANMEWLGLREPAIYGTTTAAELDRMLEVEAVRAGINLTIRYANVEGEAISWIYQAARDGVDGLLMNPAGFLYAGYALRDCLRGVDLPYVEVHISNLDRRGMRSLMGAEADGMIMGLGLDSYVLGLEAIRRLIARRRERASALTDQPGGARRQLVSSGGTSPPLSASFCISVLCSHMFMVAVSPVSPS